MWSLGVARTEPTLNSLGRGVKPEQHPRGDLSESSGGLRLASPDTPVRLEIGGRIALPGLNPE